VGQLCQLSDCTESTPKSREGAHYGERTRNAPLLESTQEHRNDSLSNCLRCSFLGLAVRSWFYRVKMEGLASSSAALGASTRNDSLLDLCGTHPGPCRFRRLRGLPNRTETGARFTSLLQRSRCKVREERTKKSDMREATT
jgi:hypothetical protein